MKTPVTSLVMYIALLCIFSPEISALSCSPGSYYPGGSSCVPCSAGYYCPQTYVVSKDSCPPGTIMPREGAVSINECEACPIGKLAPSSASKTCLDCPRGFYCPRTRTSNGRPCPPGTYQPIMGAVSVASCLTCLPGTLVVYNGAASCFPCPDGYTCPDPSFEPIALSTTASPTDNRTNTTSTPLPTSNRTNTTNTTPPTTSLTTTNWFNNFFGNFWRKIRWLVICCMNNNDYVFHFHITDRRFFRS